VLAAAVAKEAQLRRERGRIRGDSAAIAQAWQVLGRVEAVRQQVARDGRTVRLACVLYRGDTARNIARLSIEVYRHHGAGAARDGQIRREQQMIRIDVRESRSASGGENRLRGEWRG